MNYWSKNISVCSQKIHPTRNPRNVSNKLNPISQTSVESQLGYVFKAPYTRASFHRQVFLVKENLPVCTGLTSSIFWLVSAAAPDSELVHWLQSLGLSDYAIHQVSDVAWHGLAWPGLAWHGLAWPDLTWPGLAYHVLQWWLNLDRILFQV